jgi:DNA-binding MurR/RpiR family transcriptional regulator
MDQLSPSEKKVARSLLADYPSAALTSAATLAKMAGTSTPTVLRFVARLGSGSYPEFQKRLLDEITQQATSPVTRAARGRRNRLEGRSLLEIAVGQRAALLESLLTSLPPSEFDAAVKSLVRSPRRVVISGGYFSRVFAQLLAFQLDQIIPHSEFAADPLAHDISKYLDLRRDSVAIVFDVRRYEQSASKVSALVKKRGARLIVITDQDLSPSAELADIVLPVPVNGIPFDSHVALLVLVECMVEAVSREVGDKGLRRMADWEESVEVPRVFDGTAALS